MASYCVSYAVSRRHGHEIAEIDDSHDSLIVDVVHMLRGPPTTPSRLTPKMPPNQAVPYPPRLDSEIKGAISKLKRDLEVSGGILPS